MANLQYIGARYVPKFFLNPDDSSNDWKSGVQYEALTIVTYNNDSYTSRKVVPDNIGDPASNPDFWACTTKYTAALMALQTNVQNLEDFVNPAVPLDTIAQSVSEAINEIVLAIGGYVTPEMYGAVGDGVTDDTIAVQKAIYHGGNIYVSNKYLITDVILYTKSINVFGNGEFIVTSGKPLFFIDTGNTVRDIRFNGFTITGDGNTITKIDGVNMAVIGNYSGSTIENFEIDGVTFKDVSFGVYLNADVGGTFRNAKVHNCKFIDIFGSASGTGNGVVIANRTDENGAIEISNNYFSNCGRHSIYCSHCRGVIVKNNSIIDHGVINGVTIANNAAINVARSKDVTLFSNFIQGSQNISINVVALDNRIAEDINVISNYIADKRDLAVTDVRIGNDSPDTDGMVKNIRFASNVLKMPVSANATSSLNILSGQNISIDDNTFDFTDATVAYTNAINVVGYGTTPASDNIVISNNKIIGDTSAANTRGINVHAETTESTVTLYMVNNLILTAQKIWLLGTPTNPNIKRSLAPIASVEYQSAISAGASLSDVITWLNTLRTNMLNSNIMIQ